MLQMHESTLKNCLFDRRTNFDRRNKRGSVVSSDFDPVYAVPLLARGRQPRGGAREGKDPRRPDLQRARDRAAGRT